MTSPGRINIVIKNKNDLFKCDISNDLSPYRYKVSLSVIIAYKRSLIKSFEILQNNTFFVTFEETKKIMTNKEIGEKLRKLRKNKGWTLDDLAAISGQRKQHLSGIETGRLPVSEEKINKILKIYGLEIQRVIKKIKNK